MSQKQMGHGCEIVAVVLFVTGDFVGVVIDDEVKCDNPSCSLLSPGGASSWEGWKDCSCSCLASLDERRVVFNDEDDLIAASRISKGGSFDCLSSSTLPTSISLD